MVGGTFCEGGKAEEELGVSGLVEMWRWIVGWEL